MYQIRLEDEISQDSMSILGMWFPHWLKCKVSTHQECMVMFNKLVKDKDKEKWMKVMTAEMRSSEDNNSEHGDTIVKPLLWHGIH